MNSNTHILHILSIKNVKAFETFEINYRVKFIKKINEKLI